MDWLELAQTTAIVGILVYPHGKMVVQRARARIDADKALKAARDEHDQYGRLPGAGRE